MLAQLTGAQRQLVWMTDSQPINLKTGTHTRDMGSRGPIVTLVKVIASTGERMQERQK